MNRKQFILLLLIVIGITLHYAEIVHWRQLFDYIEKFSHHWWVWAMILGLKISFYALAMPGSSLIWVCAILYEPVYSTILIIGGGTLGGVLGCFLSKRISQKDRSNQKDSVFFGFLEKNSNFLALCAARIIPGFPHSVINYGSGILNVSWSTFILSTIMGFAVKGFVYSSAIHEAVEISKVSGIGELKTLWPLLILAGLMIIGHFFQRFLRNKLRFNQK
ncbi:MAG: VTT domain-containing protein [Desulfobacterales bacterium]